MLKLFIVICVVAGTLGLSGCGYNTLQAQNQEIEARWSEVLNQYQRRADLIPNLVRTVQGFAQQEKDVLLGVTEARSRVGSIQATPELLNNPAAFQQFTQAQGQLGSALSRLMMVSERYPDLKSDQNFRDLQAQLEGTENRITVARNRYIDAVKAYNTTVLSFPSNLTAKVFGFAKKPNFGVSNEAEISRPPTVNFDSGANAGMAAPAGSPRTTPAQLPQTLPAPQPIPVQPTPAQ
ncbi:MAG: LemA family protein [Nevskiaceae bacterium]|nr:MAG: LemA family protein [Nevskiaceae bacterium]TBR72276.1 MAG: LemA family protein [Nevskiaceae bacterium]